MTNYIQKRYSLTLTVIERSETNDTDIINKFGQQASVVTNDRQIICVSAEGSSIEWFIPKPSGMPFFVKYDNNPTLLSDEVVVPDFDSNKFAVYSKKLIKQDVYFNVPLPEGMTFEEADKLRLDTDVFNLINQCGEPVFDSYGDRYYYPDSDEIWSAYSYDEPIVPIKVDYLNAITYEGE